MSDSDMAKRIKELRLSLGLTLEEVANEVGVGKSTAYFPRISNGLD